MPSCIRAPPLEETTTSGSPSSWARSMVRATLSPTTLPIEPPINRKSIAASATLCPPMLATPESTASLKPVLSRARSSFSA
jgi:hypothetical protein